MAQSGIARGAGTTNQRISHAVAGVIEELESRLLFSGAFDVTGVTALRNDPAYAGIDGSGLTVAVLDTGLYAQHPDIQGNFVAYFDAVLNGPDAVNSPGTTNPAQASDPAGQGHGTHVAGTVGSTNSAIGVAPETGLISVRVLPADSDPLPSHDTLLTGLNWVLANRDRYNIRVVNMSLGVYTTHYNSLPSDNDWWAAIRALEARGVTVVTASGNNWGDFAYNGPGVSVPAVYSTISVANTWEDAGVGDRFPFVLGGLNYATVDYSAAPDRLQASSQRSSLPNQVAAPGTTIYSTWNGDDGLMYRNIQGTSMASPFVAGMVALMQDAAYTYGGRYLTPAEVLSIARSTADDIVDANNPYNARAPIINGQLGQLEGLPETGLTFKRVNVYRAIQAVRSLVQGGQPNPDPEPDPTPAGDTNKTRETAVVLPSFNGLEDVVLTGRVGTDGSVVVGADDIDLYRIVLDSPGYPRFELAAVGGGTSFDPYLRLFDAGGGLIDYQDDTAGSLYPTLDTSDLGTPLPAGTYYFGISSFNNSAYNIVTGSGVGGGSSQGDYQMTITLSNPDPNGVVQGAAQVTLTSPTGWSPDETTLANFESCWIGSDPNPIDETAERVNVGPTDVDMFKVVAPDTGVLTIDVEAQTVYGIDAVDSYIVVFDADLNEIDWNDDYNGSLDSYLQVAVEEGETYYIAATTYGNRYFDPADPYDRSSTSDETGYMDIYFSFSNGDENGTAFGAPDFFEFDVDGDDVIPGTIGADYGVPLLSNVTNGGYKDVDFFYYQPKTSGLLDLAAISDTAGFVPVLGLWQFDDVEGLVQVADTAGGDAAIAMEATAGAALYVSVTGTGNNGFNWFANGSGTGGAVGSFHLEALVRDGAQYATLINDSVANSPENILASVSVVGELGYDGRVRITRPSADVDMYRYVAGATGQMTVRTDTSGEGSANTFVRIFNAAGNELAYNDNRAANTGDSEVTFLAVAGRMYYIGISSAGPNARGYNPMTGAGAAEGTTIGRYQVVLTETGEPANGIVVDSLTIPELAVSQTLVTTVTAITEDAGATFTYALVGGAGSEGNYAFALSGNELRTNNQAGAFLPGETYSVRVRATDQDGQSLENVFVFIVADSADALTLYGTAGRDSMRVVPLETGEYRFQLGQTKQTLSLTGVTRLGLVGLDGDDTISALRMPATFQIQIVGGNGDDRLTGSAGLTTLFGGAGNDRLYGRTTVVERLNGGAGNDRITGGVGATAAWGDDGDDVISGRRGGDLLYGGAGNDTLKGGEDADVLLGEAGMDRLYGGAGDDNVSGGDDADYVSADAGNDTLIGGGAMDYLRGGAGDDSIFATDGIGDRIDGGSGVDTLYKDMTDLLVKGVEVLV